jgi:hypothetical protein
MYLLDPSTDHDQRLRVRENEAGPNKGGAGIAIADHLFSLANLGGNLVVNREEERTAVRG